MMLFAAYPNSAFMSVFMLKVDLFSPFSLRVKNEVLGSGKLSFVMLIERCRGYLL